ncbi:MAG TPA: YbaK/EbsC family protein [Anaerolineae bacterium]|nr:YbaK/EbsC family protein [Anaerolineae bacterium]
MPIKNNITRLLDSRKIAYTTAEYDGSTFHSGEEVAHLIGVPVDQVYKTIVVLREEKGKKPLLVMVAAQREIDLKKLAASVGEKKLHIAKHDEAEKLTGLQVGGISALALLNKPFEVCLDRPALDFEQIHMSGGQRGLDVKIGVKDLIALTKAKTVEAT